MSIYLYYRNRRQEAGYHCPDCRDCWEDNQCDGKHQCCGQHLAERRPDRLT